MITAQWPMSDWLSLTSSAGPKCVKIPAVMMSRSCFEWKWHYFDQNVLHKNNSLEHKLTAVKIKILEIELNAHIVFLMSINVRNLLKQRLFKQMLTIFTKGCIVTLKVFKGNLNKKFKTSKLSRTSFPIHFKESGYLRAGFHGGNLKQIRNFQLLKKNMLLCSVLKYWTVLVSNWM